MFKQLLIVPFIFCLFFSAFAGTNLSDDILGPKHFSSATKSVPLKSPHVLSPGKFVGVTDYDWQHNGGGRPYVCKSPAGGYHFYWTFRQDGDLATRQAYYRYLQPLGTWSQAKAIETRCSRMGGIAQLKDGRAVASAHVTPDSTGRNFSFIYIDSAVGAGRFEIICLPIAGTDTADQPIWPCVAVDNNNTIFVTATQNMAKVGWWTCSNDLGKTWSPWSNVLAGDTLNSTNWPSGGQEIMVSNNNKVAIVLNNMDAGQLVYYETGDQGATWTKKIIFAAQPTDSVKPYNCYGGVYDKNNVLHVAYTALDTTPSGGGGGNYGSGWRSQIRYWNSSTNQSTIVTSAWWALNPGPGANHPTVSEARISINPDSGFLYCTWAQANDTVDVSAMGFSNLELYCAKSINNGATWIYQQNMTNSHSPNAVAGACENDCWHSVATTTSDDILDVFYMNDRDAGSSVQDGSTPTVNIMLFMNYQISPVGVKTINKMPRNQCNLMMSPNPFCTRTAIRLTGIDAVVSKDKNQKNLKIFNTSGRLVKAVTYNTKTGYVWDGTDEYGHRLPSGIYLISLTINGMKYTSQLIMFK